MEISVLVVMLMLLGEIKTRPDQGVEGYLNSHQKGGVMEPSLIFMESMHPPGKLSHQWGRMHSMGLRVVL